MRETVALIRLCCALAVVCCDGTWMAPSDVDVQTAGTWTESERLEIQGPVPTGSGEAPVMAGSPLPAFSGLVTGSDPSPQRWKRNSGVCARGLTPTQSGRPKNGTGQQDAADARVPKGNPWGGKTAPEGLRALHW
jgi:hypothetical protein